MSTRVDTAPDSSPYRLANVRAAIGHYLLGRGASAVIGIITIILLVRVMDVAAYAGYIALTGLAGIAAMLSSLGLERAITRFVPEGRLYHSEDKLRSFVWKIVLTRLVATLLVTLLLAAAWQWLVALFDFVDFDRMPLALAIFLAANSLFAILSTILQALVRQKLLTQIMVLIWGGRLVAIVYLAQLQGGLGLEQVLWLMAIPELVGAAALLVAVVRALWHGGVPAGTGEPPQTTSWPQWQETRSLAGHAYAFNMLASVPQGYFMRTLVAATLPVDIVAAYGFFSSLIDKLRMYLPLQLMYNLFEPVLVARYLGDKDEHALSRHIGLMYKANLLIIVMALVFLAISGQAAVGLATAGKFVEQTWILLLLMVQIALGSHVLAIQLVVNVLKQNRILSQAGAIALIIMFCFMGAVLITGQHLLVLFGVLVYELAMNLTALVSIAKRRIVYSPPLLVVAKLVLLSVASTIIAHIVAVKFEASTHLLFVFMLGGGAGLLALLAALKLGCIDTGDVAVFKKLLRPRSQ